MRRKSPAGFTIIELLVVIAIIAILASLLLPALSSAKARAKAVADLSNLKQIGIGVHMFAHDNENLIQLKHPLTGPEFSWGLVLFTNVDLAARDIFVCPAYKPFRFENWQNIYGMRSDPPSNCISGPVSLKMFMRMDCVENPADYLLVADTTSKAQSGWTKRQYFTFQVGAPPVTVHARHFGRANGWFLDGHAEACNRQRLESIGVPAEYGPDLAVGYFP